MRNASSGTGTTATGKSIDGRQTVTESSVYVGRFAPSPTGPLHFGSLLAALASRLEADRHDGRWYVRIDDIDPPREQPEAARQIIAALDAYGFDRDGDIIYQRHSDEAHRAALERLLEAGVAYPCGCSRRDLRDEPAGSLGQIYPGTCRDGTTATETAMRVRTTDDPVVFDDRLQGRRQLRLESASGDYVIFRRDGLVAYQLAVVVDDHALGVTDIVRGIDLMDSTPRQIWLQRLLGYTTPGYAHIPVAVHPNGDKLSKLTGASAISLERTSETLVAALRALQQDPPAALADAPLDGIWAWAREHWDIGRMHGMTSVPASGSAAKRPEKSPNRTEN